MKPTKRITTAILIIVAVSIFSTCKKIIIQTDKSLYDVLIDKTWEDMINDSETGHDYMKFCSNGNLFIDTICPAAIDTLISFTWEIENENIIALYGKTFLSDDDVMTISKLTVEKYSETIIKGYVTSQYNDEDKKFKMKLCA